ncbi:MAG: DUF5685 family protein [Clostridia bacterium]|nr:DUF5685 family protein [Clostridia bacterium]
MFGYVKVNRPELKIKEYDRYQSYYCGLCRVLNENFGLIGRVTLNYDMVFLVMLLADLYDEDEKAEMRRCFIKPFKKHEERKSSASVYSSDMCILLTYYKLLDDWNDDRSLKSRIGMLLLKRKVKKISSAYEEKSAVIKDKLKELSALEKNKEESPDAVSGIFGEIMGEVFAYRDDEFKDDLYKTGFFLGKFIYLLDAYEDLEDDTENDSYNPLKMLSTEADFEEKVMRLLMLMISECTAYFERLPLLTNTEILRNILYSGVWERYTEKKTAKDKKKEDGSV